MEDTAVDQKEAYASADIVVSGVPSKGFQIAASSLKAGVVAVNISQRRSVCSGRPLAPRLASPRLASPRLGQPTPLACAHAHAHSPVRPVPIPTARALAPTRYQNFGEGVGELGNLVPAVGKVTIAMLERNLLRLHANFHEPSTRGRALVRGALLAAAVGAVGVTLLAARARRSR